MRALPDKDFWLAQGAQCEDRFGCEVVRSVADPRQEYDFVRSACGITDMSFMQVFVLPAEGGADLLDAMVAGNVGRLRYGRILHTFLADDDGRVVADCYVGNNDEEYLVLAETILDDQEIRGRFRARAAGALRDASGQYSVLSIDGVKAWAPVKAVFGADIIGLPYLSIENRVYEGQAVRLLRAGKTSEFGYLVLTPPSIAASLRERLLAEARAVGGGLCGTAIHHDLRCEGRFFDIFAEGALVGDPLRLGLQWMIDFEKEKFDGREAILQRRREGLDKKIVGMSAGPAAADFVPGARIFCDGQDIAALITTAFSFQLQRRIGLALFPAEYAYAGLTCTVGTAAGMAAKTISMPPIMPKSLTVKLDEL